jgi:hypothetical protein
MSMLSLDSEEVEVGTNWLKSPEQSPWVVFLQGWFIERAFEYENVLFFTKPEIMLLS